MVPAGCLGGGEAGVARGPPVGRQGGGGLGGGGGGGGGLAQGGSGLGGWGEVDGMGAIWTKAAPVLVLRRTRQEGLLLVHRENQLTIALDGAGAALWSAWPEGVEPERFGVAAEPLVSGGFVGRVEAAP